MATVSGSAISTISSSLQTGVSAQPDSQKTLAIDGSADHELVETMVTIRALTRARIPVACLPGATIIRYSGSLTSAAYISRWNMSAFDGALWGILVHCANRHGDDTDVTRYESPPHGHQSTRSSRNGATNLSAERLSPQSTPQATEPNYTSTQVSETASRLEKVEDAHQDSGIVQEDSVVHSTSPETYKIVDQDNQDNESESLPPPHLESDGYYYWICEKLGEGSGGSVVAAIAKESNPGRPENANESELVAIKIIPKWKWVLSSETYYMTQNELNSLKDISFNDGRYLAEVFHSFTDDHNLYIVMRYCPQTLHTLIVRGMAPQVIKDCAAALTVALIELEFIGILHMDIKPANILIDVDGRPVITDFGISRVYKQSLDCRRDLVKTVCGTCGYQSPEMLLKQGVNSASMWWALGIMLYEMSIGRPLFDVFQHGESGIAEDIIHGDFTVMIEEDIRDPDLADLIYKLLNTDPTRRLKGRSVCKHDYFKDVDWRTVNQTTYEPTHKPATPEWGVLNMSFDPSTPREFIEFIEFGESEGELAWRWNTFTDHFNLGKYDLIVPSHVRSRRTIKAKLKC